MASCKNFTSTPVINPTDVIETQTAIPVSTRSLTPPVRLATPTYFSDLPPHFTPGPGQQVYTDPAGWYSAFFPADMEPTDKPFIFVREGDFFETGYLSQLGFMSNVINVCAWLANLELEPGQSSIDWGFMFSSTFESEPRCSVLTKGSFEESIQYDIFEIPAADPEHRFAYIKTSLSPFNGMNGKKRTSVSISWLKAITPRRQL